MSVIEQAPRGSFEVVTFSLYRDVHKGIRSELFGTTLRAGNVNPSDRAARQALARRVSDVAGLLEMHAEHEDRVVQSHIETYLPDVAAVIDHDHRSFDKRMEDVKDLAGEVAGASGSLARERTEQFYIELAAFTSAYLAHQDLEERVVMPMLERELGFDGVLGVHGAIVSSVPPDVMAASLAVMLPAMNIDDRTEMLQGMRRGAPAEAFAGVWCLAGSVLPATEYAELGARLGLQAAA